MAEMWDKLLDRVPLYVLDGRIPVRCHDIRRLEEFWSTDAHVIAKTHVGDAEVSTVFLMTGIGEHPRLFETMVFGGKHEGLVHRMRTYDEAEADHARVVAFLRQ